jgi:hypothetical protein
MGCLGVFICIAWPLKLWMPGSIVYIIRVRDCAAPAPALCLVIQFKFNQSWDTYAFLTFKGDPDSIKTRSRECSITDR